MLTYKRNAGSQQQDSDKQIFELLHNQFPDALTCKKKAEEGRGVTYSWLAITCRYKR